MSAVLQQLPAAALVLLLLAGAGAAQNAGDACGPDHDRTATWMAIPASSLIASAGDKVAGTSTAGPDGCATSDSGTASNVYFKLPDGSWTVHNVTAKLSVSTPSPGAFVQVLVGDADVPAAMAKIRGTASHTTIMAKVYENFALCGKRRLALLASGASASPKQETFACDPETPSMDGSVIGFVAARLKVCSVMVCARRQHFTPKGVPLTRDAALMLTKEGNDAVSIGSPLRSGAAADGLVRSMTAGPEACTGYTTSNYRSCPKGQECSRTYKPGSGVCDCGDCSAFTGRRSCQQGDIYVGSESCCFTCPDQPICGVCNPICNPEFVGIEVTPGVLPTTPEDYNALDYEYNTTTTAVNMGNNAQQITVTFTFQQALTATLTYTKEFSFQEKLTTSIGIPFLTKGGVEFTASQKFTTTSTNTDTRTSTITYALQQQIPALTAQTVTAKGSAGVITVKVPMTIKTTYTCGKVETTENTAIIKTTGVLNAIESNLNIIYGPQYPLNPPIVLPQANATCVSNPGCATLGFTEGNCCPDAKGVYKPCCSFCFLKPACEVYAITNTTMCCPAQTNVRNPCCGN